MIAFVEQKKIFGNVVWTYSGIAKRIETIDKLTLCAYRRLLTCIGQSLRLPRGDMGRVLDMWLVDYEPGRLLVEYLAEVEV